jgi:hypothetical protein
VAPCRRHSLEQPSQWLITQPLSGLNDRTRRDADPSATREREIQRGNQLAHREVPEQAHPDDEPDHLLGRQPPAADRRCPGRLQCLVDPLGIEAGDELG